MKSKKYLLLFILVGFILPIIAYIPKGNAYTIINTSASHRASYEGVWVEVRLNVEIRIYSADYITFTYSYSHSRGKPWYFFWVWGSGEGARLYEQEPGFWTAENHRYVLFTFFPLFGLSVRTRVHFEESTGKFYYSETHWDNGEEVLQIIIDAFEPDW